MEEFFTLDIVSTGDVYSKCICFICLFVFVLFVYFFCFICLFFFCFICFICLFFLFYLLIFFVFVLFVLFVYLFYRKLKRLRLIGNRTSSRAILSVIILEIDKSNDRWYDYRPNWTPFGPTTIISHREK